MTKIKVTYKAFRPNGAARSSIDLISKIFTDRFMGLSFADDCRRDGSFVSIERVDN